jgi:hypothetical protein
VLPHVASSIHARQPLAGRALRGVASAVLVLALAGPAAAQASREEALAQQEAEKAGRLQPYRPSIVERQFLEIEEAGGFGVSRGFFVTFGGIKSGSSFAMGPVYGRTFANGALAQAKAVYSVRHFKLGELLVQSAPIADGRLVLSARARWQDAPVLAVYPLGTSSSRLRADYAETRTEISGQAVLQPARFLYVQGGAGFERFDTKGSGERGTPVDAIYTPDTLPGLGMDPDYFHGFIGGGLDTTGSEYSRSGTILGATLHHYRQQNDGALSFRQVDAVARQLIPILHGNWVVDLSARISTTYADDGETVPFFLMPWLGGGRNLRGYSSYRFRDRHTLVMTAEYRWYAQEWVDMSLYFDAGKAVAHRADLDLDGLRGNVGIGMRFHTPRATALRLELARGTEGFHLVFGWGPIFRR